MNLRRCFGATSLPFRWNKPKKIRGTFEQIGVVGDGSQGSRHVAVHSDRMFGVMRRDAALECAESGGGVDGQDILEKCAPELTEMPHCGKAAVCGKPVAY